MTSKSQLHELSYDELLSAILNKYSYIDHEVRSRYLAESLEGTDIGKWQQWVLKVKEEQLNMIKPEQRDRYLLEVLQDAHTTYIEPYCKQFEPGLGAVKAYLALCSLCQRWSIPTKVIGDDIKINPPSTYSYSN